MGRSRKDVFEIQGRSDTAEIKAMRQEIERLTMGIADLEDAGKAAARGTDAADRSLSRLSNAAFVGGAAFGAVAAGAAIVTPAIDATIGALLDQEAAMNRVQASTGLTGDALDDFEQQAEDVFNAGFGDSFAGVADSMAQVQRITGATGDELEALTRDALAVEAAFGNDLNESIRAADTLMETFGVSGGEAMDVVAAGLRDTGDPAGDLLDSLNEYAPNFRDLGFDAAQTLAILNNGLEAGARNTDDIADAYREFSIRLADGTAEEAIAGLSTETQALFTAFQNGEASGADVVGQVVSELEAMEDPLERARIGTELFGTRFEDLGAEVILGTDPLGAAAASMDGLAGAADEAATAVDGGLGGAFERAKREIQTALVDGLEPFIPAIEDGLTNAIDVAVPYITDTLIPGMVAFGQAVGPVVTDILTFGGSIAEAFGGKDAILGAFATAGERIAAFLEFLATIDISAGLAAFGEFGNILDGILPALQERAAELFTVESFAEIITGFGDNIATALMAALPEWGEWVMTNIINPIVQGLNALPGMVVNAINVAIPDDVGFDVPPIVIPNPFGEDRVIGGGRISIDLPDNPVPMPANLGNFASGGAFTVPMGGTPMAGTTDRQFAIGLTPGEQVSVAPRGGGGTRQPIQVVIGGRTVLDVILDENDLRSGRRLAVE